MEKLISVAVMRDSDASEIASGTDSKILMYRAGLGIFRSFDWHGRIDIVTGSGNNAGDGYVLALLLHRHRIPCRIVRTSEKCSPDGSYFFTKCQERGFPLPQKRTFPAQTRSWTACWERGSAGNFARICGRWWNRSTGLLRQC